MPGTREGSLPPAAAGSGTTGALQDWLSYRAAASPGRVALEAGGRSWTYRDLEADVSAVGRQLAALGIAPGERIASLLHNGPAPVVLVHAALRLGAILVPLNIRLTATELAWQLTDSKARVLVAEDRTRKLADSAARGLGALVIAGVSGDAPGEIAIARLASEPGRSAPSEPTRRAPSASSAEPSCRLVHPASAVLAIIYTSGTTGQPKGAQLTVGNFWWSAIGSALNLGAHVDERWLAVLPLFHIGGLSIVLRSAIQGTTVIVQPGFDAEEVNSTIDGGRITIVSVVGAMLQRMLDARGDSPYPATLRCVLLGGGPAPLPLLERCAAIGVPVVQTYGLTEACSQVATLSFDDARRKVGSAGRPLYPNQVRILARDGSDANAGEPGEIVVRGPIVMAGYAGQPEASARTVVDGWLHTGDVGRLDDEGFLYVLDRRDDLIISGGENVYPAEVEAVLLRHPWVVEAAVIGVPDDQWGQRAVAIVRLADGAGPDPHEAGEVLRTHCRSLLAGYKAPREIRITRDELPRTASGKLKRAALRPDG